MSLCFICPSLAALLGLFCPPKICIQMLYLSSGAESSNHAGPSEDLKAGLSLHLSPNWTAQPYRDHISRLTASTYKECMSSDNI